MFWYNLCDAQKTNSLHRSCSVSWFISSAGYFNCQSVANCQCNAPLTAALHTFPSPRWPMLNSIFKFRRFETASLCKKKKEKENKNKSYVAARDDECTVQVFHCWWSVCAAYIFVPPVSMMVVIVKLFDCTWKVFVHRTDKIVRLTKK